MSFSNHGAFDCQYPAPSSSPTNEPHPHPLRSHSTENLHDNYSSRASRQSIYKRSSQSHQSSDRPDSCVFNNPRGSIYLDGGDGSYKIADDDDEIPPVPAAIHPAFRLSNRISTSQKEGLGDIAVPEPVVHPGTEYPIVAVRPPLRPTISFGGESRMSYYSLASTALEQKSKAAAVKEELQRRRKEQESMNWRFYACFATFCLLQFVCGLGATSLATALPVSPPPSPRRVGSFSLTREQHIAEELSSTAVQTFWVANSFLLASALFQPLSMRLSHALGSKTILLSNIIICLVGSIACTQSRSLSVLIFGRSLTGASSGATCVLTQLVLHQLAGPRDRSVCERALSLSYWLGAALGPIIGGAMAQALCWRYISWINIPICILALGTLTLLLRLSNKTIWSWEGIQKVDFLGWIMLAASITSITMAISWAGTTYPATSAHTLTPLIIGIIALLFWIVYSRHCAYTLLPLSIFGKASAAVACFGTLVQGMIFAAIAYLMPLYFEAAKDLNAMIAGVALSSWTLSLVITAFVASIVTSTYGHRWTTWFGLGFVTIGTGLTILLRHDMGTAFSVPIGCFTGAAMGMLCPALTTAVRAAASTDDEAIHAAPLQTFCSMLGQALGLAVGSSIFLNQLHKSMLASTDLAGDAAAYTENALALVRTIRSLSMEQVDMRNAFVHAYIDSLQWVWVFFCILAGVALVFNIWFLEDFVPDRRLEDRESELHA